MATGTYKTFDEAMAYILDGGWEPADEIWCAILDDTVTPTVSDATPALADYTQVGTGGVYVAGGLLLDTWGNMVSEAAGIVTIDSSVNPSWAANAGNDVDAYWGLVYNATQAGDPALGFVDLGGPVDGTAGILTINWNAAGLTTISRV